MSHPTSVLSVALALSSVEAIAQPRAPPIRTPGPPRCLLRHLAVVKITTHHQRRLPVSAITAFVQFFFSVFFFIHYFFKIIYSYYFFSSACNFSIFFINSLFCFVFFFKTLFSKIEFDKFNCQVRHCVYNSGVWDSSNGILPAEESHTSVSGAISTTIVAWILVGIVGDAAEST